MKNDLTQKFSKSIIIMHWLTAFFILCLFPMGKYMERLPVSEKLDLIQAHALIGTIVLVLTIFRSYFFFKHQRPDDLRTGSAFNDKLAVWIHNAFYFLLLGIGLSGIGVMIAGGYIDALSMGKTDVVLSKTEIMPLKSHGILATILMGLFVLHVVGVIKHYLLTKENTLKRIL